MCAFHRDANGHLLVDSTPLAEIADRLGTPLYVYSGNGIRDAFISFASAVAPVAGNVHCITKKCKQMPPVDRNTEAAGAMMMMMSKAMTMTYLQKN